MVKSEDKKTIEERIREMKPEELKGFVNEIFKNRIFRNSEFLGLAEAAVSKENYLGILDFVRFAASRGVYNSLNAGGNEAEKYLANEIGTRRYNINLLKPLTVTYRPEDKDN